MKTIKELKAEILKLNKKEFEELHIKVNLLAKKRQDDEILNPLQKKTVDFSNEILNNLDDSCNQPL